MHLAHWLQATLYHCINHFPHNLRCFKKGDNWWVGTKISLAPKNIESYIYLFKNTGKFLTLKLKIWGQARAEIEWTTQRMVSVNYVRVFVHMYVCCRQWSSLFSMLACWVWVEIVGRAWTQINCRKIRHHEPGRYSRGKEIATNCDRGVRQTMSL